MQTHAYIHTYIYITCRHKPTPIETYTYIHAYIHTCILRTDTSSPQFTYTHAHIHTYTYRDKPISIQIHLEIYCNRHQESDSDSVHATTTKSETQTQFMQRLPRVRLRLSSCNDHQESDLDSDSVHSNSAILACHQCLVHTCVCMRMHVCMYATESGMKRPEHVQFWDHIVYTSYMCVCVLIFIMCVCACLCMLLPLHVFIMSSIEIISYICVRVYVCAYHEKAGPRFRIIYVYTHTPTPTPTPTHIYTCIYASVYAPDFEFRRPVFTMKRLAQDLG